MTEPTLPSAGARDGSADGLPERYRRTDVLGLGANGLVVRAWDTLLDRPVAIKILAQAAGAETLRTEARLTAHLQHPGIVAVHDMGTLPDGRPWYAMQEVQGDTLGDVAAAHRHADTRVAVLPLLERAARILGFAHHRGIAHLDVKPDNVMVGSFGEVVVVDWGLGRREAKSTAGLVSGTPGYLAPEQARGEPAGATADVHALGATLVALWSGRAPRMGEPAAVIASTAAGMPVDLTDVFLPPALHALAEAALDPDPARRPADGTVFAQALSDWLLGMERRKQAADAVARGAAAHQQARQHLAEAQAAQQRGEQLLDGIAPHQPVRDKRPGWDALAEAKALEAEADAALAAAEVALGQALAYDPDQVDAHTALARLFRDEADAFAARGDASGASRARARVQVHDRGEHRQWLAGTATLVLDSVPSGAQVTVFPVEEVDRRWVEGPGTVLGTTPLEVELPAGRVTVVVEAPEHHPIRLPLWLKAGESWRRAAPDGADALVLPPQGTLGADDIWMAGSWFISGGDALALDGLTRRELWVDDVIVRRFPVTNAEYAAFLNACGSEATALAPHLAHEATLGSQLVLTEGRYAAGEGTERLPVVEVSWHAAMAYARWLADQTGLPWRLLHDQEWEKAARGTDGRTFPWGPHLDPTWASTVTSDPPPRLRPVDAFPEDASPWGIRGLGGNSRDLCLNRYTRSGEPDGSSVLHCRPAPRCASLHGSRRLLDQRGPPLPRGGPLCHRARPGVYRRGATACPLPYRFAFPLSTATRTPSAVPSATKSGGVAILSNVSL